MPDNRTFVIVGGGLAAASAAKTLRSEGFGGRLAVIAEERHAPYVRPPLSKAYLQGKSTRESLLVNPETWYVDHDVELLVGVRAVGLDRPRHEVILDSGHAIAYDAVLLATGSSPRELAVPGADPDRVLSLRRVEDADRLRATWHAADTIAVIGGGWIGLEVAAAARSRGLDVTVIERSALPLARVLGDRAAQVFTDLHLENGVDLRLEEQVHSIVGAPESAASTVVLESGAEIDADLVVVGVGARPNTDLAVSSGLDVDDGIVVDEHLRTTDPAVFAAGDVARAYHPLLGRHVRVEHWANAVHQPVVAARSMMGQHDTYDRLPYFYTDQYDLGMEYVGYAPPGSYDEVVFRGDVDRREFVAFWISEGRAIAGMSVNTWDVIDDVTAIVRSAALLDIHRLTDVSVPQSEHYAAAARP